MQRSFEQVLAAQCAPTLAGVKPASLFRWRGEDLAAACRTVAAWGRTVARSGLSVRVLKLCPKDGALLVYVYRERQLAALLADGETQAFLRGAGYCPGGCGDMLTQLSRRLRCAEEFPHEIGVFLGYPLEDVKGFIRYGGRNFTCAGCWKAYGDPDAAARHFAQLNKCTRVYLRLFHEGTPIFRLAVAA